MGRSCYCSTSYFHAAGCEASPLSYRFVVVRLVTLMCGYIAVILFHLSSYNPFLYFFTIAFPLVDSIPTFGEGLVQKSEFSPKANKHIN